MSKKSRAKKNAARAVALCAILGLLFAVAAPAMIFLGASQQAETIENNIEIEDIEAMLEEDTTE